ncbi:phosphatase PAP2 family protein [Streptomyces sp. NPDC059382]|uniref:phosphatase PAP2 family protein n=1 Tax=Streptomyces sp. NPDC059382 TaxID=3346816 RepID=UPI0036CAD634
MNASHGAGPPTRGRRPGRTSALLVVLVGACAALAALTTTLLAHRLGPLPGDTFLARLAVEHRPPIVVVAFKALTATGTGTTPYALAAAAGLLLTAQADFLPGRRTGFRRTAAVAVCAGWLALGQAIRLGLMTVVARPRPPESNWLTHASRHAFPSGHTTTSAMAAGLVIIALAMTRPPGHRPWIAALTCWAVLVGASRVWLGVHWATDVIAGWLLALAWSLIGAAALAKARDSRSTSAA